MYRVVLALIDIIFFNELLNEDNSNDIGNKFDNY